MKTIKLFINVILLCGVVLAFESCGGGGGDAEPTPDTEVQRVTKLLTAGQWGLTGLTIDGVAKGSYTGFNITFGATGSYTSSKGEPVWPTNGTWMFSDETAKTIKRSDQTDITVESINEHTLVLSFTWSKTTFGPGRMSSVPGKHVFTLGK